MFIQIDENNSIINILHSKKDDIFMSQLLDTFPNEFKELQDSSDVEIGDKYIESEIIKPNLFFARLDENNMVIYTYKAFDKSNFTDDTIEITSDEYELLNSGKSYRYIDDTFEEYEIVNKEQKLNMLETYYNNLMEQGLNYNGYVYDISQEAQEDRRDIADTINESLDLYGEDSEQMQYVLSQIYFMPKVALPNNEGILGFKSIDEWKAFSLAFMTQVVTNSNIYYSLKQKIELATTQEELDNIKF